MRGFEQSSDALFVYVSPESFVPQDHPLRPIRQMVDTALENLSPVFNQMYSHTGRVLVSYLAPGVLMLPRQHAVWDSIALSISCLSSFSVRLFSFLTYSSYAFGRSYVMLDAL
jgi:hypothetical protein